MKVNRLILENKIKPLLSEFSGTRRYKDELVNKFKQHKVLPGEVADIISIRIDLPTLPLPMLCLLTIYMYKILEDEIINPEKYFTELEIKEAKKFTIIRSKGNEKYPIVFENCLKFGEDHFITKITLNQIFDLFNKMILVYNPETQRPLISKEYGDRIIKEIDINKKSIKEIKNRIKKDLQIPDELTFNILQNGKEVFEYDDKHNKLTIHAGELDIADGYHRLLAGLYAYQENNNIDFYFGLDITNWDVDKTLRYIHQKDLKNKLNPSFKKAINPDRLSNTIIRRLNENSKSYLRGKITTDKNTIKSGENLIMFDVISDVVDIEFNPKDNKDLVTYSKYIMDGVNTIIELKPELLEENNELIWCSIIIVLKELYNSGEWEERLEEFIENINFEEMKNIKYTKINKKLIKEIKENLQLGVTINVQQKI